MGRRRFRARADAAGRIARGAHRERTGAIERAGGAGRNGRVSPRAAAAALWREYARTLRQLRQLPRAHGDRKSVGSGKSESVRVDLGGRSILKKKKKAYIDSEEELIPNNKYTHM